MQKNEIKHIEHQPYTFGLFYCPVWGIWDTGCLSDVLCGTDNGGGGICSIFGGGGDCGLGGGE